jgi:hypothetical protein
MQLKDSGKKDSLVLNTFTYDIYCGDIDLVIPLKFICEWTYLIFL